MNFIFQKLVQWLVVPVVSFFVTKGIKLARVYLWFRKTEADMEKANEETVNKTEAATTADEKKEATEDALKKF